MLLQKLDDCGLFKELWQYLKVFDICQLLVVNNSIRCNTLKVNELISVKITLRWPSSHFDHKRRKIFNNILKSFPKISYLTLLDMQTLSKQKAIGRSMEVLYKNKSFCKSLKELSVRQINKYAVKHISNLTELQSLNISSSEITNEGFKEIFSMSNLRCIVISY